MFADRFRNGRSRLRLLCLRVLGLSILTVFGHAGCASTENARSTAHGQRRRVPMLIRAKKLPSAIVDFGRQRHSPAELRRELCEEDDDEEVVFYQLVMSRHWHFYWLCSDDQPRRAASRKGDLLLRDWLDDVKQRAIEESGRCKNQSKRRLFSDVHRSGTKAVAMCDGTIILAFVDGGRRTSRFPMHRMTQTTGSVPDPRPSNLDVRDRRSYPAPMQKCPPCPAARCPRCPVVRNTCAPCSPCPKCPTPSPCPKPPVVRCPRPECPPPRCPSRPCPKVICPECPKSNTPAACRTYGQKTFDKGVKQTCQRLCTAIYRKCRAMHGKQTALCYKLSEHCAALPGICGPKKGN